MTPEQKESRKEYQRKSAMKRYYAKRDEILLKRKKVRDVPGPIREKHLKACRDRYYKNPELYKKQVRERVAVNIAYVRNIRIQSKCARCPENHPACLDFHHIDPSTKDKSRPSRLHQAFDISWSIERIKKEIDKCEILCSNCHRKEHHAHLYSSLE
jgi:hypothetical protein